MAVPDIGAASSPRPAPQVDAPQPKDKTSAGISAYATAYGQTVSIFVDNHWEQIGNADRKLNSVKLSSLPEWYWGLDNAWHVRNDSQRGTAPDLDSSGHLALDASKRYLPVVAIDNEPIKYVDRASKLAAMTPGVHELTVLDGAKFVAVERTVPERLPAPNSPELARQLVPYLANDDQDADVEGFVGQFPRSASSGIVGEANAFKGPKIVAAAAVQVLGEMLKSANKDAWKEQFVPLLGQVRDHQKVAVPSRLVQRVVAQLSDTDVHKYGRKRVEALVRQFIEGAARQTYRDAGRYLDKVATQLANSDKAAG